jgi:hypothetical protein
MSPVFFGNLVREGHCRYDSSAVSDWIFEPRTMNWGDGDGLVIKYYSHDDNLNFRLENLNKK